MSTPQNTTIFWFRRDLRIDDNTGLFHALKEQKNVLPLFVFDTAILSKLPSTSDARVSFIHENVATLKKEFEKLGGSMLIKIGDCETIFAELLTKYTINAVYTNRDYEPEAERRDQKIKTLLTSNNITFHTFKDQVIFEKSEVVKDDGLPYTIYTPYSNKWLQRLASHPIHISDTYTYKTNLFQTKPFPLPSLADIGFKEVKFNFPPAVVNDELVKNYEATRNFPAQHATSRLSVHLRFGTISIRRLALKAMELKSNTYLKELIWREFYMMILHHFPYVTTSSFKPNYERIVWRNNEEEFLRWCRGQTGYPIVDAGMRELNTTGFMHNRVRMITASFLVKHLLIDWRWGEQYFADKLLDFELSSNNGGWQWSAGCGCDAAPYFRVFNPSEQTKKFDSKHVYIKKYVPNYDSEDYPKPMVDHAFARERVLKVYAAALNPNKQ